VHLVEHQVSGAKAFYALKQLPKQHIIAMRQVDHILSEKEVLFNIDHPFCNTLIAVMLDEKNVYMLLEVALGGELFSQMRKVGSLQIDAARFYATCIASAIAHLHGRKTVYRDLKPENVLIDELGYPKLIDFGFAKRLDSPRTWTLCGTPHYLAPEMITSQGHGFAVDWWAFGVLVYEMLVGTPPFNAESELAIYQQIIKNRVTYGKMNAKAKDLISSLLVTDPLQRLGSGKRADEDVIKHGFLRGGSLSELHQRTIPAPWVPKLKDQKDTTHFDYDEQSETIELTKADQELLQSAQYRKEEVRLTAAFQRM